MPSPITLNPPEMKVLGLPLKVSSTSVPLLAEVLEEPLVVVATPPSKLSTPLSMWRECFARPPDRRANLPIAKVSPCSRGMCREAG